MPMVWNLAAKVEDRPAERLVYMPGKCLTLIVIVASLTIEEELQTRQIQGISVCVDFAVAVVWFGGRVHCPTLAKCKNRSRKLWIFSPIRCDSRDESEPDARNRHTDSKLNAEDTQIFLPIFKPTQRRKRLWKCSMNEQRVRFQSRRWEYSQLFPFFPTLNFGKYKNKNQQHGSGLMSNHILPHVQVLRKTERKYGEWSNGRQPFLQAQDDCQCAEKETGWQRWTWRGRKG